MKPLNRGMQTSHTELGTAVCNWWGCSAHPKHMCCKVHRSTRCRLLPGSVHPLHRAQGLWGTSVFLCTGASVAFQNVVCARCILVSTGPASPALHRSFPGKSPPVFEFFFPYKKYKEWSELKESKIVNQFRDCVYVFPPFLGVVRVTGKEQYSEGGQRLLLKKQ